MNRPLKSIEPLAGVVLGCVGVVLVAAALAPFRSDVANTSVALVLVLVVVGAATIGGRAGGIAAAMTAVLAFDFFHTAPYLRLTINSADDLETAVLLGLVGLVVGTVAAGRASAEQGEEEGRSDLRRVHLVAELVVAGASIDEVRDAACRELTDMLQLVSCRYEPAPWSGDMPALLRSGALPPALVHRRGDGAFALPIDGLAIEVMAGGRLVGRFVLCPIMGASAPIEHRVVAVALADQVGAAIAIRGLAGSTQ